MRQKMLEVAGEMISLLRRLNDMISMPTIAGAIWKDAPPATPADLIKALEGQLAEILVNLPAAEAQPPAKPEKAKTDITHWPKSKRRKAAVPKDQEQDDYPKEKPSEEFSRKGIKKTPSGSFAVNVWDPAKQQPKYLGAHKTELEAAIARERWLGHGEEVLRLEEMLAKRDAAERAAKGGG